MDSTSWLRQVFASRDFWISLSVAVVFFIGGKASSLIAKTIQVILEKHQKYTVTGFWIGSCELPSYKGQYCVEIWKLVQRGEDVDIDMFAYSPIDGSIDRCTGSGVIRAAYLSAFYYSCNPKNTESGVLALRTRGTHLRGTYAQFDTGDPDERFYASDGDYTLSRIALPLRQSIKMWCGRPPLRLFDEVDALYRGAQSEVPAVECVSG